MREERVEGIVAWMANALDRQKTFGRERDEEVGRATLRTAERDSANAMNHEVFSAQRLNSKQQRDTKEKFTDTHVKLHKLFDEDRKVAVPTQPAVTAKPKAKVTSLTSYVKVEELEIQTLPGLVEGAVHSRQEVEKVRTEASDFNGSLESLEVQQTEDTAFRYQTATCRLSLIALQNWMTPLILLLGKMWLM